MQAPRHVLIGLIALLTFSADADVTPISQNRFAESYAFGSTTLQGTHEDADALSAPDFSQFAATVNSSALLGLGRAEQNSVISPTTLPHLYAYGSAKAQGLQVDAGTHYGRGESFYSLTFSLSDPQPLAGLLKFKSTNVQGSQISTNQATVSVVQGSTTLHNWALNFSSPGNLDVTVPFNATLNPGTYTLNARAFTSISPFNQFVLMTTETSFNFHLGVPEPGTCAGVGLLALCTRRRR